MASFGPIAPFYDELMKSVPYDMWLGYWELLLLQQEVRPNRVLDICCGTGTLCEMLSERGYSVTGFDLSKTMIAEARRKAELAGLNVRYEVADARTVDLGERFDAAFSFFDSLNYITDAAGLRSAIHSAARHLRPGASFIFDLNTAYAFEQKMFDQQDTRKRSKVHYNWVGDYDKGQRIIRVEMDFWVDGQKVHEVHVQRAHREDEVREFLAEAGFESVRIYDSYTLDPPRARSDRVHYTAILSG